MTWPARTPSRRTRWPGCWPRASGPAGSWRPAGPVALGEVGIANTTVAAGLAAALLGVPPGRVAGRGAGSDTAIVARKEEVIGQALARMGGRVPPAGPLSRAALCDLLGGLGGPEQVFLTGACLGTAAAGGLVVLDGLLTGVSALAAVRYRPEVQDHLIAGQRSAEPAPPAGARRARPGAAAGPAAARGRGRGRGAGGEPDGARGAGPPGHGHYRLSPARAGSPRTRPSRARGSAARPGSAGWRAPRPRRRAGRTRGRSPRRASSGRPPP